MRIISIESNFRRPGGHRININPSMGVIALIGANGTGKTSTANAVSLAAFKEAISDAGGGNVKAAGLIADEGLPPGEKELVASVGWSSVSMPSVFRLTAGKTNSIKTEGVTWPEPPHAAVTDILRRSEGVMVRDLSAFVLRGVEPESMFWLDMPAPLKAIMERAKNTSVSVWFKQALDTINERIKSAQAEARVLEARAQQGLIEVLDSDIEKAAQTSRDYTAMIMAAAAWDDYEETVEANATVASDIAFLEGALNLLAVPTGADEKRVAALRAATGVARYYLTSKTTPRQCPCCGAASPTITEAHVASVEAAAEKIAQADVKAAEKRKEVEATKALLASARRKLRPEAKPDGERVYVDEATVADAAMAAANLDELVEAKRKWDEEVKRAAQHAAVVESIATLTGWRDTLVNRQREMVDDRLDGFIATARAYMPRPEALNGRTLLVDLKGSRPFIGLTDREGNRYKPCGGEWQAIVVAFAMAAYDKVGSPIILPDINWGAPLLMACVDAWNAYPGNVIVQVAAAPAALDARCNTLRFDGDGGDDDGGGGRDAIVPDADAIEVAVEVTSEDSIVEGDAATVSADVDAETRYPAHLFASRDLKYRLDARSQKKVWSTVREDGHACLDHMIDGGSVLVSDAAGKTFMMACKSQIGRMVLSNNAKAGDDGRARAEIAIRARIGADGKYEVNANDTVTSLGWKIVACEVMPDRESLERRAAAAVATGVSSNLVWRNVTLPTDRPYWYNHVVVESGLKGHPSMFGLK